MYAMKVSRAPTALRERRLIEPVSNADNRRRKPFRVNKRQQNRGFL